jgi:hypothetical protein
MTYKTRICRALALCTILAGATFLALTRPGTAEAQETKCYLVACTGNVCVWKEIKCPEVKVPD